MPGTLTLSTNLQLTNGQHRDVYQPSTFSIDQSASGVFSRIVSVTTTEAAISITGLTSMGVCILQNLDSTNYVTWGPESGGAMASLGRLKPLGIPAILNLEPSGVTLRFDANTAPCLVLLKVYEA